MGNQQSVCGPQKNSLKNDISRWEMTTEQLIRSKSDIFLPSYDSMIKNISFKAETPEKANKSVESPAFNKN